MIAASGDSVEQVLAAYQAAQAEQLAAVLGEGGDDEAGDGRGG